MDFVVFILCENVLWLLDNFKFIGLIFLEYLIIIDGLFMMWGCVLLIFYFCGVNWYINNVIKIRLKWNKWVLCSEVSIGFKY